MSELENHLPTHQSARTFRGLLACADEGETLRMRASRYGDQIVQAVGGMRHSAADEGSYFVVTNPTPGTGIQLAANVTSFSDTNALFVFQKSAGKTALHLDYIRLLLGNATTTGGATMEFVVSLDRIKREPTTASNRTVLTPVNVNGDSSRASDCQVYGYANAGAMTIPASSGAARKVARCSIVTADSIRGDSYVLSFGGTKHAAMQGLTGVTGKAKPSLSVGNAPPVSIGPGQSLVIHMWWITAAITAPTFEYEIGWWER